MFLILFVPKIESKASDQIDPKVISFILGCEIEKYSPSDTPVLGAPYNIFHDSGLINASFEQKINRKIFIDPSSLLNSLLDAHKIHYNQNGWPYIEIPKSTDQETGLFVSVDFRDQIVHLGYKISGFSEFGSVEVVENQKGDIFFLDCSLESDFILNYFMQ